MATKPIVYNQKQLDSQKALKAKIQGATPGADNPNQKLYGNITPGLNTAVIAQTTVRPAGTAFNPNQDLARAQMAYNAQQVPQTPAPIPKPTTTTPTTQKQTYGGLSEGFIKSNPNQAVQDLIAKGFAADQARSMVNGIRGGKSVTLTSGEYLNQPVVPSLDQSYQNVEQQLGAVPKTNRELIAQQVASDFAPQIAEQKRLGDLRNTQYSAAAAQRGDIGFGRSDLGYLGELNTAAYGADQVGRLEQLQALETQARIAASEDANYKRKTDYLTLASQFRQQALQEFQQNFQNQLSLQDRANEAGQENYKRAQSTLEYLTELDPVQLQSMGDISSIEGSLGLPSGYINALKATKEGAAQAQTKEDFSKFLNEGTELALKTPDGQDFTLSFPGTGDKYTFTGSEKDVQIVSNDGGIWAVDRNTQKINELRAPQIKKAAGSGGSSYGVSGAVTKPDGSTVNLSARTKAVYENPALLTNFTPTERGKILDEIASSGLNLSTFAVEDLTASQRDQISQYDDLVRQGQQAETILSETKLNTGPFASKILAGKALFGGAQDFTNYRGVIDNMSSSLLKLRSGAAVTPQEFERIKGFVPSPSDDEKTAATKIKNFYNELDTARINYVKRATQTEQQILDSSVKQDQTNLRSKYNY